jgi:hypothetical protein
VKFGDIKDIKMGIILDIKKIIDNYPNYKIIKTNLMIKINNKNEIKKHLEEFQNKCGVYIFLNNENIPIYIGSTKHSYKFKGRISMQLSPGKGNSTLINNIAFYHCLCGQYKDYKSSYIINNKKCAKRLLIKYAPKLMLIDLSHISDEEINQVEKQLIFKYRPKYNWTLNIKKEFQTS